MSWMRCLYHRPPLRGNLQLGKVRGERRVGQGARTIAKENYDEDLRWRIGATIAECRMKNQRSAVRGQDEHRARGMQHWETLRISNYELRKEEPEVSGPVSDVGNR